MRNRFARLCVFAALVASAAGAALVVRSELASTTSRDLNEVDQRVERLHALVVEAMRAEAAYVAPGQNPTAALMRFPEAVSEISMRAGELSALGHEVDVVERLACPYGLLRYGVAPDHLKMKALESTLRRILERPGVRFLGGVEVGTAVTVPELAAYYDAVVYATGASADRRLGIDGEDLPGSVSATELVRWYSGHPDAGAFTLDATSAFVIGVGNVALDLRCKGFADGFGFRVNL